jgi:drug/metabolite transporter (DMT)-like permease
MKAKPNKSKFILRSLGEDRTYPILSSLKKDNTILVEGKFGRRCQKLIIKLYYFVPSNMEKQKRAYIYAAIAIIFWSTIAAAFKISLPHYLDILDLSILHLLFYASLISTITLFINLFLSNKIHLLKSFTKADYLHSAALGFLNPFLYYFVLINAYSILTAQEAMTINWLWPMTLVLLSIPLLKQKIKPKSIIAITISFFGVLIIATRGNLLGLNFTNPIGILLALGSTLIWSLFWIYNTKDKHDETVRLFMNFVFGTFFIFISLLMLDKIEIPDLKGILGAAYIGLFEMGITFLLWLKAMKLSKTTAHIANLVYLTPFLSLLVISIVVDEKILISTIIGLLFIVGGIILQKFQDYR